ncbi:MAG: hypothetical protein IPN90_13955 [Elusimicrobia bacterium]|nr:hypothetical protein [Elusimicrobiota bacterium]
MVQSPVNGFFYTEVKAPMGVTSNGPSSKVGRAMSSSVLGLIATGDSSIEAAAKNGKITKIHHVDYEAKNILGIYSTFTTVVYGE